MFKIETSTLLTISEKHEDFTMFGKVINYSALSISFPALVVHDGKGYSNNLQPYSPCIVVRQIYY